MTFGATAYAMCEYGASAGAVSNVLNLIIQPSIIPQLVIH